MKLIMPFYSPAEAIEILNTALKPTPLINEPALLMVIDQKMIDVWATSNKGNVMVTENARTIVSYTLKQERRQQTDFAYRAMIRDNAGVPTYTDANGEKSQVPIGWDAVFKREDLERFIESKSGIASDEKVHHMKKRTYLRLINTLLEMQKIDVCSSDAKRKIDEIFSAKHKTVADLLGELRTQKDKDGKSVVPSE